MKNGKVVRGYLGVGAQDLTITLAESLGLDSRRGALIADVRPNSPAAKAGLKNGDVITAVNGQPVEDSNRLTFTIGAVAPGTKVDLAVLRDGQRQNIKVTVADRAGIAADDSLNQRAENEEVAANDEGVLNGVAVDNLSPQLRQQLNLPARLKGAVITSVEADSAAAKAGLKQGDVILEINKQPVHSAQDAVALSAKAEGKKTLLRLFSRGNTLFVVVDETEKNAS